MGWGLERGVSSTEQLILSVGSGVGGRGPDPHHTCLRCFETDFEAGVRVR